MREKETNRRTGLRRMYSKLMLALLAVVAPGGRTADQDPYERGPPVSGQSPGGSGARRRRDAELDLRGPHLRLGPRDALGDRDDPRRRWPTAAPCQSNGYPGITLRTFAAGTYGYTLDGVGGGHELLYAAYGRFDVDGDV